MTRREVAMNSFLAGYNCSQCLILAFEDLVTKRIDKDLALSIASPFGGGMGRLREVCGSVSGMFMVLGYMEGYADASDTEGKKKLYADIQELARRYEEANGSIICRELLGLTVKREAPEPEVRTEEYYKKRPCTEKIGSAAEILEGFLKERGIMV